MTRDQAVDWFTGHFDPLLAEHADLLHQAASNGHALIVEITNPARPLLSLRARAELVAADVSAPSLAQTLRAALAMDPAARAEYAERASQLLAPYREDAVLATLRERVLPALGIEQS